MAETVKCDAFADIYKSLEYCTGNISIPGTRPRAVFIPKKHVTGWPTLPMANATEMGKVAVLDGNFTLEADKYFHFLDLVDGENEPKSEQVGSFGSMHFSNTLTLVIPGTEEEATGLATMLNNEDVLFIYFQRNGKARVLGNEMFRTSVKPSQNVGKATSDSNNTTLEVTVEDVAPAPFYPGDIVIDGGVVISGATGKVKTQEKPTTKPTEGGSGS